MAVLNGAASATDSAQEVPYLNGTTHHDAVNGDTTVKKPLKLNGVLDEFMQFDVTPMIGKEFPTANLVQWMRAPNSDELLKDLAITSMLYIHKSLMFGEHCLPITGIFSLSTGSRLFPLSE